MIQPLWRTVWRGLIKIKIELLQIQQSHFWLCIRRKQTLICKDMCTSMFIRALFTITETWKQLKSPLWYTQRETIIQLQKRMKSCYLQQHGWSLRVSFWNTSDRERQILYDLNYMWNLKNKTKMNLQIHRIDWWLPEVMGRNW